MNIYRKAIDDYDHLQELIDCVTLHRKPGYKNKDIKKILGISDVRVTRALDEYVKEHNIPFLFRFAKNNDSSWCFVNI